MPNDGTNAQISSNIIFSDSVPGASNYVIAGNGLDQISNLSYKTATGTYTVTFLPSRYGPGYTGPLDTRSIAYGPADQGAPTGAFVTFRHADAMVSAYQDTLTVLQPGQANNSVTLTYVTYGIHTVGDGVHFLQTDYIVFGAPTIDVPKTGTADYSGYIDGTYNISNLGQTYRMSGTATLHADFGAASVGLGLNFTGVNLVSGRPDLAAQSFTGTGTIAGVQPGKQFNGTFSGPAEPQYAGQFGGNFYGPGAKEFGLRFTYGSQTTTFSGVAIGKAK